MVSELWVRLWPAVGRESGHGNRESRAASDSEIGVGLGETETRNQYSRDMLSKRFHDCTVYACFVFLSLQTTKASCQGYGLLLHAWRLEPLAGVIQRAQPQRPRCALAVDTRLRMLDLQTSAAEEPAVVRIGAGDVVA